MRSALSSQSRRELVQQMAPRYQEASRARKIRMLDAFVAITGYVRTYAIHLLNHPEERELRNQQARPPSYGPEVQQALLLAWKAAKQICTKRLIPFLPTLVEALEQYGRLHLTEECREKRCIPGQASFMRTSSSARFVFALGDVSFFRWWLKRE